MAVTTPADFNQSIRELLEVVRTSDLSHVTDLPALNAQLRAVTATIEPAVVDAERMQAGLVVTENRFFDEGAFVDPGEYFPYSPVLGILNPVSPVAQMRVEDDQIVGSVTMGSVYNGPPGSVHGGMIALVMDELLGSTCVAADLGAFTGTLSVRYQRLVPLDTEVKLRGWVDRIEGRKVFAKGEISLDEVVLTTAEGIFIRPADAMPADAMPADR